jgi:hypothetical protein
MVLVVFFEAPESQRVLLSSAYSSAQLFPMSPNPPKKTSAGILMDVLECHHLAIRAQSLENLSLSLCVLCAFVFSIFESLSKPVLRIILGVLQELLRLGVDATGNLRARAPARTRSPSDRVWATRLLKIQQGSKTHFVNHSCFPITITSTVSLSTSSLDSAPL